MPHLAIVIVSYNTCELLRSCLRSVFRAASATAQQLALSVTVVDNASRDDSSAMVRAEFPTVSLIASDKNLGFTRANNLALRTLGFGESGSIPAAETVPNSLHGSVRFSPDFVLLLNPDTEVAEDALLQMVQALQHAPKVGACGAHLRYGDGTFQQGAFHFPGLAQVVLDLFPLGNIRGMHRLYQGKLNGRYPRSLWEDTVPFAVDFVLGAALMVKAEAIREVGLLDETFFMYCEEMDWCLRMQNAGWQIMAVPTAHVTHYEGQSSRQIRWTSFVRLWQSRLRFYEKHSERYSNFEKLAIRILLRIGFAWRKRSAMQRFASSNVASNSLSEEISAYREIINLL